jgi:hypothetical protein
MSGLYMTLGIICLSFSVTIFWEYITDFTASVMPWFIKMQLLMLFIMGVYFVHLSLGLCVKG